MGCRIISIIHFREFDENVSNIWVELRFILVDESGITMLPRISSDSRRRQANADTALSVLLVFKSTKTE